MKVLSTDMSTEPVRVARVIDYTLLVHVEVAGGNVSAAYSKNGLLRTLITRTQASRPRSAKNAVQARLAHFR